jgi:peptide deformylase
MIRQIVTYPSKVLRKPIEEITEISDEILKVSQDMVETMYAAHGVGLAANQIGLYLRMVTVESGSEKKISPLVLINPRVLETDGQESAEEGCLSIPGFYETIKRAKKVLVGGISIEGREFTIECDGLLARACQHELDHLNGILFVDHLSPIKKQLFKREYKKDNK